MTSKLESLLHMSKNDNKGSADITEPQSSDFIAFTFEGEQFYARNGVVKVRYFARNWVVKVRYFARKGNTLLYKGNGNGWMLPTGCVRVGWRWMQLN